MMIQLQATSTPLFRLHSIFEELKSVGRVRTISKPAALVTAAPLPDLIDPSLVHIGNKAPPNGPSASLEDLYKLINSTRIVNVSKKPLTSTTRPRVFGNRSLFYVKEQRRNASFFMRRGESLEELEQLAQESPEDAKKQAALYRVLVQEDPEALIRRFEDQRWARDQECVIHYLCALYETSQLERAVQAFLAKKRDGPSVSTSEATVSTGTPSGPTLLLGTKERPLYVYSSEAKGGKGWRRLGTAFNIIIVGSILYSLFSMNEQRLESMTGKVHHMFKKGVAERVYTFADVQGCDEAKHELEDLVAFLKNPEKFTRLGARMPKGVLLVGPPGNGKTLLAKAVAGEADVPFFYASGSSFDELFVGVGSMRIRKLFEQAKANAPSIVFIDELDAVGSKRNPRDPQHSRMSLNQLLTELDGFAESSGVIVIAATNIPEALDKALLRPGRFDKQVYVAPPDMRGRKKILEMYLGDVRTAPDVDLAVLARSTPGFSGADLAKLVNEAKIAASLDTGHTVTMHHLEASKDEMLMGAERKSTLLTDEDKLLTAYHEGGHALMALRTRGAVPIHKATIIPRGQALGMVTQLPEKDELSLTRAQLLARMDVAMGGRVAEELVFGHDNITTGAASDFQQATAIARAMVTQYGMSEKIGPLSIDDPDSASPSIRDMIDAEVKALLTASHQRAARLLTENRRDLELLARSLIEYETLSRQEIDTILSSRRTGPLDHLL